MVTIKDYKTIAGSNGEKFHTLILQGKVEPQISKTTGRVYFTARTASVPTTLDESTCKQVLGTAFSGEIRKVACEPYEYAIESTGEIVELSHRWEYINHGQAES